MTREAERGGRERGVGKTVDEGSKILLFAEAATTLRDDPHAITAIRATYRRRGIGWLRAGFNSQGGAARIINTARRWRFASNEQALARGDSQFRARVGQGRPGRLVVCSSKQEPGRRPIIRF